MKLIWLLIGIVMFIAVTVMCFIDGFEKWVFYYPLVLLAFGMYFFKVWMMKRMEKHVEYMSKKEKERI
ncbi:hypothetical protein OAA13_01705 [Crocinitomicaceae bacterium]|nr:hypothetical protein [Crocinitomicaceae bacterium]MDC3308630.1 hypothetical protein [Crocinitomicaceae bacterium]